MEAQDRSPAAKSSIGKSLASFLNPQDRRAKRQKTEKSGRGRLPPPDESPPDDFFDYIIQGNRRGAMMEQSVDCPHPLFPNPQHIEDKDSNERDIAAHYDEEERDFSSGEITSGHRAMLDVEENFKISVAQHVINDTLDKEGSDESCEYDESAENNDSVEDDGLEEHDEFYEPHEDENSYELLAARDDARKENNHVVLDTPVCDDDDPIVKAIEHLELQSTFGYGNTSTSQLVQAEEDSDADEATQGDCLPDPFIVRRKSDTDGSASTTTVRAQRDDVNSRRSSLFADDGPALSFGTERDHEEFLASSPRSTFHKNTVSVSTIDHTEHPAFRQLFADDDGDKDVLQPLCYTPTKAKDIYPPFVTDPAEYADLLAYQNSLARGLATSRDRADPPEVQSTATGKGKGKAVDANTILASIRKASDEALISTSKTKSQFTTPSGSNKVTSPHNGITRVRRAAGPLMVKTNLPRLQPSSLTPLRDQVFDVSPINKEFVKQRGTPTKNKAGPLASFSTSAVDTPLDASYSVSPTAVDTPGVQPYSHFRTAAGTPGAQRSTCSETSRTFGVQASNYPQTSLPPFYSSFSVSPTAIGTPGVQHFPHSQSSGAQGVQASEYAQSPQPPFTPTLPSLHKSVGQQTAPVSPTINMKIPRKPVRSAALQISPSSSVLQSPSILFCSGRPYPHDRMLPGEYRAADEESKENIARQRLADLRHYTGTEIVYHDSTNSRPDNPKHPNHTRVWKSKNIRCYTHSENCSICYASCCVYKGALQIMRDVTALPEEKVASNKLVKDLGHWIPAGYDAPTFVQCTSCQEWICPSCASICPVFPCHDRLCKKCKPEMWKACTFHGL